MNSTRRNLSLFCLVLALAGSLLAGCSAATPSLAGATSSPSIPTVRQTAGVSAEGHVVPRDSAQLAFLTAGDVSEVLVKEGDHVTKDAELVMLGNREPMEAAVTAAKLAVLNAQQALNTLNQKAGLSTSAAELSLAQAQTAYRKAKDHRDGMAYPRGTQVDIDNAWSAYQLALSNVARMQDQYDHAKVFPDDSILKNKVISDLTLAQKARDQALANYNWLTGKPTEEDLNTADAQVAVAKAKLDDAQRELDQLKNGPDPDQLALAQAQLDNARAQRTAAQASLDALELKAPFDGTVVSLNIAAKEHAVPGQPVLLLADLSEWYVETSDLTEMDVVKLAVGQAASVVPDALPDLKLKGRIDRISDGFTPKGGDILYTVRI
ncbi:MAG: efflux RND transporter periplasmic adaptor subunit, partial [Anaerolineaceae bacterium]|nr:efflux RND transporter periplasmic adaptor subunit [Anaerolineaceae bacterium]